MDPNATLKELRELAAAQLAETEDDNLALREAADRAMRMSELVEALDGWMTSGGFPPNAWSRSGG